MTLQTKWTAAHDRIGSQRVAIIINHFWPNCRKELIIAAIQQDPSELYAGEQCWLAFAQGIDQLLSWRAEPMGAASFEAETLESDLVEQAAHFGQDMDLSV